jgi:glutamyl-tRNA synthetase
VTGRFAPSPTGDLHLGNLRTALVAWLAARSRGGGFIVRMEDLDRVTSSVEHERRQLADLAAIGLEWDGDVVRQSGRFDRYREAIVMLDGMGLVYPCYCSRREIQREIEAAASAPHGALPAAGYPGTCRDLTTTERVSREAAGRPAALRLRTEHQQIDFVDLIAGVQGAPVDDVVLQRGDGVPAYNLAVVVDDAAQGVTQVVRGDDLLSSTPRQVLLQQLLGLPTPEYLHVPLVLGTDGERLAKRHGAVTLSQLADHGVSVADVVAWLATSLDLAAPAERIGALELLDRFDPTTVPRRPVTFTDLSAR